MIWEEQSCTAEMNRFYDLNKDNVETSKHFSYFTRLLAETEKGSDLLDLGCGTAILSEYCKDFNYHGADLKHTISGCSMRNYPNYLYRSCDILKDDLSWIKRFPVVTINAVIDVMGDPLIALERVLSHASKYVIIHRQEIISGATCSIINGAYGGQTYHSKINRKDFLDLIEKYSFEIKTELNLEFGNWENGGNSFLLRKRQSFSINSLDYKLNHYLGNIENGKFIEAGANDGETQSNTLYFERFKNWTGILIEPMKKQFQQCVANRSPRNRFVNAALVPDELSGKDIELNYVENGNGLQTSYEIVPCSVPVTVKGYSLNSVLDICGQHRFDLMSLDIEGYEPEALRTFDFSRFKIEYLLIEERQRSELLKKTLEPYYREVSQLSEHDYFYRRK